MSLNAAERKRGEPDCHIPCYLPVHGSTGHLPSRCWWRRLQEDKRTRTLDSSSDQQIHGLPVDVQPTAVVTILRWCSPSQSAVGFCVWPKCERDLIAWRKWESNFTYYHRADRLASRRRFPSASAENSYFDPALYLLDCNGIELMPALSDGLLKRHNKTIFTLTIIVTLT